MFSPPYRTAVIGRDGPRRLWPRPGPRALGHPKLQVVAVADEDKDGLRRDLLLDSASHTPTATTAQAQEKEKPCQVRWVGCARGGWMATRTWDLLSTNCVDGHKWGAQIAKLTRTFFPIRAACLQPT